MAGLMEDFMLEDGAGVPPIGVLANTTINDREVYCTNAAGWAVPATDAANLKVVGVARGGVKNGGSTNGAVEVVGYTNRVFKMKAHGALTQASLWTTAYVKNGTEFYEDRSDATNTIKLGVIVGYIDANYAWVYIQPNALALGIAN